jgi:hypothetical protein
MDTIGLPETVVQAWGTQASQDFMGWLEERVPVIQTAAHIQISAFVARQKVNVLMLEQVSNLLLAGEPALGQTPEGHWQWCVPIDLTFPARGRVGRVGEVIVDARYGSVQYDDALLARITDKAENLARQTLDPAL